MVDVPWGCFHTVKHKSICLLMMSAAFGKAGFKQNLIDEDICVSRREFSCFVQGSPCRSIVSRPHFGNGAGILYGGSLRCVGERFLESGDGLFGGAWR